MRSAFAVTAFVFLCLSSTFAYDYHGKQWQQKSASEKYSILSKGVAEKPTTPGYPGAAEQALLFVEGMPISFEAVADDMPKEILGWVTRRKLVHSVGLMASAQWTPVANQYNYSGIFSSGHPNVMVRFSTGNQPDTAGNSSNMIPAVAFKFLRNGVPSANIHTLGAGPQASFNFFAHDFSNHVPDFPFTAPFSALAVRQLFATASDYPTYLGLNSVAAFDVNGNPPPNGAAPSFPWRIIFHPTAAWHAAFPDGNPGQLWYKQLANGLKTGPLFTIWAIDGPQNDANIKTAVQIGQITLTSVAKESFFGDRTLFYEHIGLETDFKYKPYWQRLADQVQLFQRNQTTQFAYADLPWK